MKKFLLLIIFSCLTTALFAQTGTINGRVTDHNQQPVTGATVTIKELNKQTMTDHEGRYELSGIKYGTHTIHITSITTHAKSITVIVNSAKTTANAEVNGDKDQSLQQVTVQGKTEKRKIETSGFAVNVVDTKEASLRNLQTNELLNRTVGVKVRQSGGIGSEANYNLNGMSGRAIGIFIDGIEISTYGSSFNLNNIPPALIERVEVYKGVLPPHLSGDFLGGGINVILKKGASRDNFIASVSYGSFNTQQADVSGTYRNPKNGLTMRGSAFYTYSNNDYEVWGKFVNIELPDGRQVNTRGKHFNDDYRSVGGRLEAGFTDVKWADNFMVNYNFSDTYDEVQHGQYMSRPYMGRFTESQAHVVGLDYRKNNLLVKGLNFSLNGVYSTRTQYIQDTVTYAYDWSGNRIIDIHGRPVRTRQGAQQGAPTMLNIDRAIASLRANLSYNIVENHRITYSHLFNKADRDDLDPLKDPLLREFQTTSNLTKNVSSLSYEADLFDGRLHTNLFGKIYQQKIDRDEPLLQNVNGQQTRVIRNTSNNRNQTGYGFAASYALKPNFVIVASAEKAIRMPGENEIFGNQAENQLPNTNIRPETSNNYNLGLRLGSYQFNGHRISASVGGFYRDTKDKIVLLSNDRASTIMETTNNVNLNGVTSVGFETEVNYIYRRLNIMVNLSKFNALMRDKTSNWDGLQIPNEPFFTANANAQYSLDNVIQKKSVLNLYYNFGYVHPFRTVWPNIPEFDTPRQFIQDLGASYRLPNQRIVVSLDAKNILNNQAYDNFAAQKPGRAFYVKLTYNFNKF